MAGLTTAENDIEIFVEAAACCAHCDLARRMLLIASGCHPDFSAICLSAVRWIVRGVSSLSSPRELAHVHFQR
jgi:hypothetical protein